MDRSNPVAGGVFITLAIIIGFVWGVLEEKATLGVIVGTGAGIVIAALLWLRDRRS